MRVELDPTESTLLHRVLADQLKRMEDELAHTEKRTMQREIAADAAKLRDLIVRLKD